MLPPDNEKCLVRYTAPTKVCSLVCGQIWKHVKDDGKYRYWIQSSQDSTNPEWLPMGEFLERVFADKLLDKDFIGQCLDTYQVNELREQE